MRRISPSSHALENEFVPEAEDTVAPEFAETADVGELDSLLGQVDQAVEVGHALEAIGEVIFKSQGKALSLETVDVLRASLEGLLTVVGFEQTKVPALESYREAVSQPDATQLALESVGEKIDTVIKAIIAAIKKVKEWLVDFFRRLFDTSRVVKKRAGMWINRADHLKGSAKSAKITGAPARHLAFQLQHMKAFPADVNKIAVSTLQLLGTQLRRIDGFVGVEASEVIKDMVANGPSAKWDPEKQRRASGLSESVAIAQRHGKATKYATTPQMLGGWYVLCEMPYDKKGDDTSHTGGVAMIYARNTPFVSRMANNNSYTTLDAVPATVSVPTLSPAQIKTLAQTSFNMAKGVEEFRAVAGKLGRLADEIAAAAQSMASQMKAKDDDSAWGLQRMSMYFFQSAPRWMLQEPAKIAQVQLVLATALFGYCSLSGRQYECESPEPAPAAVPQTPSPASRDLAVA